MRIPAEPFRAAPSSRYRPPQPGEALGFGHGGPQVADLQARLNAAGATPPLEVDGKFGPKTLAQLKALTGKATAEAGPLDVAQPPGLPVAVPFPRLPGGGDGFAPPAQQRRPTLEVPVAGKIEVPVARTSDRAQAIVGEAFGENDSINPMKPGEEGGYHGWRHLQTVFEKTTGWRPADNEVRSKNQPGGKSWCGVWACHVLQKAGVDVKWDLTKGKMVGDVTHVLAPRFTNPAAYKTERAAFEASIKPGDVITLNGKTNHHAIVTKVNDDGTLETMDGNKPHVGPGKAKLSDVTTYYRANDA